MADMVMVVASRAQLVGMLVLVVGREALPGRYPGAVHAATAADDAALIALALAESQRIEAEIEAEIASGQGWRWTPRERVLTELRVTARVLERHLAEYAAERVRGAAA